MGNTSKRRLVIISIMAAIAAIHIFRLGSTLDGALFDLYYGYFSDLIMPFAGYFLLCAAEGQFPFLRQWQVKAAIAFLAPAIAETCQYFGIPVLGSTFDGFDYLAYALGVAIAVLLDRQIFSRYLNFWNIEKGEKQGIPIS